MKEFVQDLDGRRNLEAITLQGHLKAAAVAFRCQRQLILGTVVHVQFLYFHIIKNKWVPIGYVSL